MFFLFSLYLSSLNLKYLKVTKMDITRFAIKLFNIVCRLTLNKDVKPDVSTMQKQVFCIMPFLVEKVSRILSVQMSTIIGVFFYIKVFHLVLKKVKDVELQNVSQST